MLLEVKDLRKAFHVGLIRRKEIIAVDKISFDVEPKKFISLVGESGSGKTTTAKMILRLLPPTSGSVMFEGRDVWRCKKIDELRWYWRQVHAIFQDPYASYNPLHKIDSILYQAFNLM